jgi:hypothetical protein
MTVADNSHDNSPFSPRSQVVLGNAIVFEALLRKCAWIPAFQMRPEWQGSYRDKFMTPDLQKEFQKLRKDALQKLRNIAESGSYTRMFTLFIEPSFEPSRSFTLYAPRPTLDNKDGVATQLTWRSDIDGEKLRDPVERLRHGIHIEPTIESDSWKVDESSLSSIRDRLSKIAVPIYAKSDGIGLDGTSYEFQYNQRFHSISLKWWEQYPSEWRPFTEALMDIYKMLTCDGH